MGTMLVLVRHHIGIDTHSPVIVFWVVRNIYKNEKPYEDTPKSSIRLRLGILLAETKRPNQQ